MYSAQPKRTDSVKLLKKIQKILRKSYDKRTAETLSPFIAEFESTRNQMISTQTGSSDLATSLQTSALYFRYIKSIESKLDLSLTKIKFTWYDSYGKSKAQSSSYAIERIGVLYNIGAMYSKLGADIDLKTQDGPKLGLNYFQMAAGCFDEVRKWAIEQRSLTSPDTSPENLSFLSNIMIAQAYLCMYDKLDKNSASKINLTKLSQAVSKNYGLAYDLATSEPISRNISEELRYSIRYQQLLYSAYAKYWTSFIEREEGSKTGKGFGKGVARLRSAHDAIQRALQLKGIRGLLLEKGRTLMSQIATEKDIAEQDNINIYIDSIPDIATLPEPEDINMIQAKFPPMVDIISPLSGEEVLSSLVSPEIMQFSVEYREILNRITNEETGKVDNLNREINQVLSSMNLPEKLDANSDEIGIPENSWNKISQLQSAGGIQQLDSSLQNLLQFNVNNTKVIAEIETMINREDQDDDAFRNLHRNKWTRKPSNEANIQLKQEIGIFKSKLAQAIEIDKKNKQLYDSNQQNFELLTKTKSELDMIFPNNNSSQTQKSQSFTQLSLILTTLGNNKKLLTETVTELSKNLDQDNITETLIKMEETKTTKETTFDREISKFNSDREAINQIIAEIRNNLQILIQCNTSFDKDKSNIQQSSEKIELLQRIENGIKVYNDLTNNNTQGLMFHSTLSKHLSLLHQKATDFVFSRTVEKNELLDKIQKEEQNKQPIQQIPYGTAPDLTQAGYYPSPQGYPYAPPGGFQYPSTFAPQNIPYSQQSYPSTFSPQQYSQFPPQPGQFPPQPGYMPGYYPSYKK